MINAINALLECVVTGLFTAVFLVVATKINSFPVMIVQYMTPEEADALEEVDDDEQ